MKTYPSGSAATVTIPFVDDNGDPVIPTAAAVRVLDEDGGVLLASHALAVAPGDTEAVYTVSGALNTVAAGKTVRVVVVLLTTADGAVEVQVPYVVRAGSELVVPRTSFQTYYQAILLAQDMPRMDGWGRAGEAERTAALIEAYDRLTRIGYEVRRPTGLDTLNRLDPGWVEHYRPRDWPLLTPEQFRAADAGWRMALRKAQIVEADIILNGDVIAGRRRAGLMSETIGESSMMFRAGKPLSLGVSEEALRYLTGFVTLRAMTGRA
ncbi:hypothetical protein [Azospirillum argentinense]|uniref:hypothetical protein n=1 Tax=Azospirillum argentinense TaxID=2970906 RepID=UPI0032DEE725